MGYKHENNFTQDEAENEDLVFYLRIQYRRNSSWQGTIHYLNSKKTCIFRSVLELGNLLHEAKSKTTGESELKSPKNKGWEDKDSVS